MNDQTTTENATAATPAAKDAPKLDDLSRAYFSATNPQAESAVAAAMAIAEFHKLPVSYNWPAATEPMPDGYDVAIIPLTKRTEDKGNVPVALWVAAIPSLETIAAHEGGQRYIADKIADALINKLANSVRPNEKKTADGPLSVPLSVDDFIVAATRDQGLSTFREHAKDWVKALRDIGLIAMNASLLRQVLSSAKFAEQQFPKIPQAKWVALIDKMLARAAKENLDPGIIAVWKASRDETVLGAEDFDLAALDAL
jgi:hypothetical protein